MSNYDGNTQLGNKVMWKLSYSEIIRSLATVSYLRSVCSDQHVHVSEQP